MTMKRKKKRLVKMDCQTAARMIQVMLLKIGDATEDSGAINDSGDEEVNDEQHARMKQKK